MNKTKGYHFYDKIDFDKGNCVNSFTRRICEIAKLANKYEHTKLKKDNWVHMERMTFPIMVKIKTNLENKECPDSEIIISEPSIPQKSNLSISWKKKN